MEILYAFFMREDDSIEKAEKELFHSFNKIYDLYHNLLYLIIELADYEYMKVEQKKQKIFPSYEDLNPNLRFVNNRLLNQLRNHDTLNKYLNTRKINWSDFPEFIKKLYNKIKESTYYQDYMNNSEDSYNFDKKFLIDIYLNDIVNNEDLNSILEDLSIYWNDEIEFVIGFVIKTLKNFKEYKPDKNQLYQMFKNEDDVYFAKTLLRKSILKKNIIEELIKKYLKNWELERIAFIDNIILNMAIVEAIEFKDIPIKVTINEYIELAKYYSTDKSSVFINGLLDKIFSYLKETKQIIKEGKGLIGEDY